MNMINILVYVYLFFLYKYKNAVIYHANFSVTCSSLQTLHFGHGSISMAIRLHLSF